MPTMPDWSPEPDSSPASSADPEATPSVSLIVRSMARPSLVEALSSIARQSYPRIEVVVVNARGPGHPSMDDGCGRFPLRFIDRGRPLDRSAAANVGLDAARGDYIGFLDDDDLLFPDHVSVLVAALKRQPKARVAYSGVRMIAYLPDGTPGFETVLNQPFHLPSLRAQNYIPMHAVLFERALVAEYGEFLHVDQVTACYRNFGHSGFGLQADAAMIATGRAALFDKWRQIWSGAELSEVLMALLEGVIHKQAHNRMVESPALEPLTARLAEQHALLAQVLARLDDADRRAEAELGNCQRRTDELTRTVLDLRDQLAERSRQLEEVYQSTSWQITRPLRGLVRLLRRPYGSKSR